MEAIERFLHPRPGVGLFPRLLSDGLSPAAVLAMVMRSDNPSTDITSLKLKPHQREWLHKKTDEETDRRGKNVPMSAIIRALIQRQIDYETEFERVQDDEA